MLLNEKNDSGSSDEFVYPAAHMCINDTYNTWNNRLGHATKSKLKDIPCVKNHMKDQCQHVCVTWTLAKFQKLPYSLNTSHEDTPFALVHMETWGPYKVATIMKYRFFLTMVDDCTRMIWIYLMETKGDY